MKFHPILILCSLASVLWSLPSAAQKVSDLPSITGSAVDSAADLLMLSDMSAGASKKITLAELVNVSSFKNDNFLTGLGGTATGISILKMSAPGNDMVMAWNGAGVLTPVTKASLAYTLPIAGASLGGIKSSADIIVDPGSGVATVNASATGASGDEGKIIKFATGGAIATSGNAASISTSGGFASIYTTGNNAGIYTTGNNASISTTGLYANIQTRGIFKIFDGTNTTDLLGSQTEDRVISFPNASGTLALTSQLDGRVPIREVPVFTKASWSRYSNSTSGILSMTSRRRVIAICDATNLKLVFQNCFQEVDGYSPITVKAAIEDDVGTFYPVTFSDSRTVTVPVNGSLITSDPVAGLTIGKGRTYFIRVNSSWSSGNCYLNSVVDNASQTGEGRIDSVDYTDSGTITANTSYAYSCNMVLGTPTKHNPYPTVVFLGDSNFDLTGQGGYEPWEDSWTVSALGRQHGRNFPYIRLSAGGSRVDTVNLLASSHRRQFYPYGSIVIVLLGTNDARASVPAATIMANLQTLYREILAAGAKEVWGCTLPPDTSGSNQNAIRTALNTLLLAEPTPLRGVIDIDKAVSTAPNSNVWLTDHALVDGYHFSATGGATVRELLRTQLFSNR